MSGQRPEPSPPEGEKVQLPEPSPPEGENDPASETGQAGETAEKLAVFLDALALHGTVGRAARESGLTRKFLFARRKEDPAFASAWAEAAAIGASRLEDEAWRLACQGWEEPVWYGGELCGTVRKFSERLLILLLQAHFPEKYREIRESRKNARGETLAGAVNIYRIPDNERD